MCPRRGRTGLNVERWVVGMIDPTFEAMVVPEVASLRLDSPSTPLRRAADRLQDVLPPGWWVEIADVPRGPGRRPEPVLRIRMPED